MFGVLKGLGHIAMFIQVGNDGSRTRMITLFVLVFIVFFVIPYFRDKSNEALPVVVDPQIQSASELTYITLFPLKGLIYDLKILRCLLTLFF